MRLILRSASFIALFAAALAANAQMIVSGGSISFSGFTEYNRQIGSLLKFDPALGTLTGVSLTYGYAFDSTITVTAFTNASGSLATESAVNFQSPDGGIQSAFNAAINALGTTAIGGSALTPTAFDLTGSARTYNMGAGQSMQYSSTANGSKTASVNASLFAAFLATPSSSIVDVYGQTLTGVRLSQTGGSVSAIQQTFATQTIGLRYTYTPAPVPEPSALAALGLGALALLKRRKRV